MVGPLHTVADTATHDNPAVLVGVIGGSGLYHLDNLTFV
jgi:purine nucleoside phosphorylase